MAIKKKYKFLIITLLIIFSGALFYTFFVQIRQIKPEFVGLKVDINNPIKENLETVRGYVVFMPLLTQLEQYPITIQTANYDSLKITAKDGIDLYVNPSVSYQLDDTKVAIYYKCCGSPFAEMKKTYLKELTKEAFQSVAGLYSSDSLINNRLDYEKKVHNLLSSRLADSGLLLRNVVSYIFIPKHIQEMINLRSQAVLNTILSDTKIKQWEAEAREQFLQVNAERRKDSLRATALTPLSIQKMFIDKWDGRLNMNDAPQIFKDIIEDKK